MYSILKSKLEGFNEQPVKFAQELISIPSPSLNEEKISGLIAGEMRLLGYDKVLRDKTGNVIGIINGRKAKPNVLLNSHMDTISFDFDNLHEDIQIRGKRVNGSIIGAGACDCKGGIAAQIYAGALLKHSSLPLDGNLIVAVTVAEENGRSVGLRSLLNETLSDLNLLKPDYAILGEPTGLAINYGHDGWFSSNLDIRALNPFVVEDAVRCIRHEFNVLFGHESNGNGTRSIRIANPVFEVGNNRCEAMIQVDRRILESETAKDLKEEFQSILAGIVGDFHGAFNVYVEIPQSMQQVYTGLKYNVTQITNPWSIDPFNPIMLNSRRALSDAGCEIRSSKWQLEKMGMGTAGGTLVNEFHIPTIGYGPGEEAEAHKPDEVLEISKLYEAIYGTACIAHGLIGLPTIGWTSEDI